MEKFNRAVRRHHRARLKQKRSRYWGFNLHDTSWSPESRATRLGIVVSTPQVCSCLMGCGNARRFYGRTLKETLQLIDLKKDVLETEE